MGRPLGSFDSDELDRPDLNKCPDCGCFFATDDCPLCGKICPEEMRAGNRQKVKPPKKKKGGYSGRVQFIPWYHTWVAMILISFVMPLAGIILFITSPYSKKLKIAIVAGVAVWLFVLPILGGLLLPTLMGWTEGALVNDDLSRTEYIETCEDMGVEDFQRYCEIERYVTMELTVEEKLTDDYGDTYYRCTDGTLSVYLRDCRLEERVGFLPGDMIRVWGESGGIGWVNADSGSEELPCLLLAYADFIG